MSWYPQFAFMSELDLSANTRLESIVCRDNRLTSLILPENDTLMELLCQNNLLSSLDISQSFMLTILRCDGNPGDGVSTFPVAAWFDTQSIPSGWSARRSACSVWPRWTPGLWRQQSWP